MADEIPDISNTPPELIPPPASPQMDPRGAPPESFTREVTPKEEADLLMGLMGSTYGELKKLDDFATGSSALGNKSEEMKRTITNRLNEVQRKAPAPPPPPPAPAPQPQVQPQPASQPVVYPPSPPESPDQLTFNFDINEKDILFDKIEKLTIKVNNIGHKLDQIFEVVNKPKTTKKKTVKKEEI